MTRHSAVSSSSRLRPHDCRRYSSESFRCCLHWNNRRCGFLDLLLHVQHGLSVYLECGHVRLMGPRSSTKRGNFRGYLPGHCKYWKYAAHGWYSQPYLEGGSSNVAYRTLSTVPPPAGYWPHERYYLYFTMGQEMPPKLTPHLIHGSLDPAQFTPQTAFRSVQAFSRKQPTDRQTHRPCYICSIRPHLVLVLRYSLKLNIRNLSAISSVNSQQQMLNWTKLRKQISK